jgi:hypothetical protein
METDNEVREFFMKDLGRNYDPKKLYAIVEAHRDLREKSDELTNLVTSGSIDGTEFANKANYVNNEYFDQVGKIIGADDYKRVFEVDLGERIILVDPDIAAGIDYTKD